MSSIISPVASSAVELPPKSGVCFLSYLRRLNDEVNKHSKNSQTILRSRRSLYTSLQTSHLPLTNAPSRMKSTSFTRVSSRNFCTSFLKSSASILTAFILFSSCLINSLNNPNPLLQISSFSVILRIIFR